jgi:thiazole/oxazole-forming peptide maturase SagD family component
MEVVRPLQRPKRASALAWVAWGDSIWVSSSDARPCVRCLVLRRLGREGSLGQDQGRVLSGEVKASARELFAWSAELLTALQGPPLQDGEAWRVARGQAAIRVPFVVHPDCEVCYAPPRPSASRAAKELLAALDDSRPRKAADGQFRDVLTNPDVGPIDIEEVTGRPGVYPLDQPFIWGSVHLSRWMNGKLRALSTHGGIYASRDSLREARIVALSEGTERLAVRFVSPDVWGRADRFSNVVRTSSLWGTAESSQVRAFSHGVDLVHRRPVTVPYEAIVVGLPSPLYPAAARTEPFYSGAASHVTLSRAILGATVELTKRDAFMISWYRRRALPRLEWPRRLSPLAEQRRRYLERQGVELEVFDLTLQFPLPTLLLRLRARRGKGNWPKGGYLLVPSGGWTWMEALEDGLRLAASQWVSIAIQAAPMKDPLNPQAVRTMARRAKFWPLLARYLNPATEKDHAFLGPVTLPFPSEEGALPHTVPGRLERFRQWFEKAGLPWIAVRLTDELAQRAGFETVKVCIPGFVGIAPSRATTLLKLPRMHADWTHATVGSPQRIPHPLY